MEQEFFADDEHYLQLLAVEDELRFEYAQGNLTGRQRTLFEARYLTTSADRDKVDLAKSVLTKTFELETRANPKSSRAIRWREWFSKLSSGGIPQMGAACAALVVMLGAYALVVQFLHLRARVSELEAQASRNGRQASQSVDEPLILSFVLAPSLTRDLERPKPLTIGDGADVVRFQLEIPQTAGYKSYQVQLQNVDGALLWSQDITAPVMSVPSRILPPGDYEVIVHGINSAGKSDDAGDFYFTVVHKEGRK
jgi:hypothetical protein